MHVFYWLIIKCSFIPITFHGLENAPKEPSIIVSNHQSSLDIPLIGYTLKAYPHIWLAVAYLMTSPVLRFILPLLAILVDTSSPLRGMRSLNQAIKHIASNNRHVIIFPEGSRYVDAMVHEFFSGFVILARRTGRPVVPVRIFGAYKVYPPNSFLVQYHPIHVVVGKPMRMQEGEEIDAFKQRVRAWFLKQEKSQYT